MDHPNSMIDYFFKRQKQLSNYEGESTRLKNILLMDASEGVKTELHRNNPMKKDKILMNREEFFSEIEKE